jgi:ATP-dependent Zn protease
MTTDSNPEAVFVPLPASDSTDERLSVGRAAECVGLAGPAGETLSARSPETNFRIAAHEAGHVIVHRVLGHDVHECTIVETVECSGRTTWGPHPRWTLPDIAASSDRDSCDGNPGPGEPRDGDTRSLFSDAQAATVTMMGGGAAEMALLGDSPPRFMGSDLPNANGLASMVCRTTASVAAFIEYAYQEALAIIEENKSVVVALAQALIDHPDRTLNSSEIDAVIVPALAAQAAADKIERRERWAVVENNAAQFRARSES